MKLLRGTSIVHDANAMPININAYSTHPIFVTTHLGVGVGVNTSEITLSLSTSLVEWNTIVKKVTMMVMVIDVSSSKRKRSVAQNS